MGQTFTIMLTFTESARTDFQTLSRCREQACFGVLLSRPNSIRNRFDSQPKFIHLEKVRINPIKPCGFTASIRTYYGWRHRR